MGGPPEVAELISAAVPTRSPEGRYSVSKRSTYSWWKRGRGQSRPAEAGERSDQQARDPFFLNTEVARRGG